MCEICHSSPHLPRCPYAPEPIVGYCEMCGEPILEGDTMVEYDWETFHEECFFENHKRLCELIGAELTIAEEKEEY